MTAEQKYTYRICALKLAARAIAGNRNRSNTHQEYLDLADLIEKELVKAYNELKGVTG